MEVSRGLGLPGHFTVGAAARILALCATGIPAIWVRDTGGLVVVLALAIIWAVAISLSVVRRFPAPLALLAEAAAVTVVCAVALDRGISLHLTALAVTPFLGGIRRGIRGASVTLLIEIAVLTLTVFQLSGRPSAEQSAQLVAGLTLGLGLGLIGAYVQSTQSARTELAPYRDVMTLLEQLLELSDQLDNDLDPHSVGRRVLTATQDQLPTTGLGIWEMTPEELRRLPTGSPLEAGSDEDDPGIDVLGEAAATGRPALRGAHFAIPLDGSAKGSHVLLLGGRLPSTLPERQVYAQLRHLHTALRSLGVHLEAALMFAELRHVATQDERRRLAREMHDGVAQDIASMGYLVDALAEDLPPSSAPQIELLRSTITRVVAEVRTSVTALRMDVDANQSLGEAVSGLARRLSASSGISIRSTVDERTTRLQPEVESELLRIAQEALTNAVKHSGARSIDVTCQVDAPRARIVVRDNGRGLGPSREDSHGLTIMRERAALVGASLTIDSSQLGTVVYVSLGSRGGTPRPTEEEVTYP